MNRPALALLLIALALASPARAEGFSASVLKFGWDSLDAAPSALEFHGDGTFTLEALHVGLEVDTLRMAQAGDLGAFVMQPPRTERTEHGPSLWQAQTSNDPSGLFVIPGPAAVLLPAGSGSASVPAVDCLPQPDYFDSGRPLACPDVGDAVHVKASTGPWTLTGDFTIVLWSWSGTVREGGSESAFWTGAQPTSFAAQGVGEHEYRQAYLTVRQGTLSVDAHGPLDLYATRVDAAVHGTLDAGLEDPRSAGTASRQLLLTRGPTGLQGQFVQASPGPAGPGWAGLGTGLAAGAAGLTLFAAPLAIGLARTNQDMRHLALANDNLQLHNDGAAARHAAHAGRTRRLRSRAGLVGAVACIRSGDLDGAQRFLDRLHSTPGHDEASCRYLLAHLRVLQGRVQEGQDLLEDCLRDNPACVQEAARNPVLAPVLDPSRWPRAP